ncbi:DUF2141 domain-containing protein [Flavobacteriaceae bacterium MHTCC 0001]
MQYLIKIICLFILSTSLAIAQEVNGNSITVSVTNLKSNDGKVFIALYDSKDTFLNKGFKAFRGQIYDNSCVVEFKNIPNGEYAVSIYHDENGNNKMDTSIFGIPKEDYGCSNNAKGFMGPPKWDDAKFTVQDKSITQNIKL